MQFCPNCDNFLDISKKTIGVEKKVGAPENFDKIIKNILNKSISKEKLLNIFWSDITKSDPYKDLSSKDKETLKKNYNYLLQSISSSSVDLGNKAYYTCVNCYYSEEIRNKTKILTKTSNNIANRIHSIDRYKEYHNSNILPRTKNFICPNSDCEKKIKPEDKEAVFFRPHKDSLETWYTCSNCSEVWLTNR
jgi:DNA-directed RNA polymerase subunit M/transcription elongation factor TFIIS